MSQKLIELCVLSTLLAAAQASAAEPMAGSAVATIDACSLLNNTEIQQAVGLPVDAGLRRDAGLEANGAYSSACVWTIQLQNAPPPDASKPLGGKSFVILNAMQWPAGSGLARTFLDAFRAAAVSGEIPSQPSARNFGDEALWWGDGLAVRQRDVSFGVSVFMPGVAQERKGAIEEKLAPHILKRLDARDKNARAASNK